MVNTTIEYGDDCIEVEVTGKVYEYLEQDRRRQQAQDRSDRRHLSKGTFEQDCIGSQRVPIYSDETYLEVIHKMELEKLRSALQTLSSNEQVLIELYYYKDWSMERIGQHFGISRMAVSKRHNRVIKKRKTEISNSIEIFNKIIDEGTISDSDLRMLIDKIEISEQDGKLDINIILNGKFKEHTLDFGKVQRLNLVS